VVPTDAQSDQVRSFIADARRQAAAGNFAEAEASLQKADKLIPDWPETAQARSDIAAMATPQGQLATQLARARAAIDQNDGAAAEKALAEAERLNPQAPEIAVLRQALQTAQQKETRRNNRITALLTTMREAIARHDLAAADSALNEAERIDLQDPSVRRARVELSRARNAGLKTETQN
jgi:tetratricopeptide (TPR) repeat protein